MKPYHVLLFLMTWFLVLSFLSLVALRHEAGSPPFVAALLTFLLSLAGMAWALIKIRKKLIEELILEEGP